MKIPEDPGYSVRATIAMFLTAAPGLWGWLGADTLDNSPRWICLGVGASISLFVLARRGIARRRKENAEIAANVAEHLREWTKRRKGRKRGRQKSPPSTGPQALAPKAVKTESTPVPARDWAPLPNILTYFGPPCWAVAFGLWGNRYLDAAPPVEYPAAFISFHHPYKSNPVITVTSWRPDHRTEALRFDVLKIHGISWKTERGTPMRIAVRPGFFGWPWVESARSDDRR